MVSAMTEGSMGTSDAEAQLRAVYEGRRVLVTGGTGFIGSHLVEELIRLGSEVHIFARAGARPITALPAEAMSGLHVHWGNLTDHYSVRQAVHALANSPRRPMIFHLGAQAHVAESWQRPVETLDVNVYGTLYLLQAVLDENIDLKMFDLAGTSEEFGNVDDVLRRAYDFREDGGVIWSERSPVNPQSPYASSKVAADFLCRNYFAGYGVPTLTTRMFNNFGPRQSPRYITGTVITQALTRDVIEIGNTSATRDFTYVLDGARGHLHAAAFGEPGGSYVFGYGEEIEVLDWTNLILEIGSEMGVWGEKSIKVNPERERPGHTEVVRLGVDYDTFAKQTGWQPSITRREGIKRTIEYFHARRESWQGMPDWM
jgi:dTDP-glucose 4,6-dehydratase